MIEVTLPPLERYYVYAPFDGDSITQELIRWLSDNTTEYWNWELDRRWVDNRLGPMIVFRFASASDATLFKLTWAP